MGWHPFAYVCLSDALLNYDASMHFRMSSNAIFMGVVPPNRTIQSHFIPTYAFLAYCHPHSIYIAVHLSMYLITTPIADSMSDSEDPLGLNLDTTTWEGWLNSQLVWAA